MSKIGSISPVQAWALVPVKSPSWAKTRLSVLLSASERAEIQWAMLQDVLIQLNASKLLAGVAIVTPDARIQALVVANGVRVFNDEPPRGGLNAAVAHGANQLRMLGADLVAVLPGDVPQLTVDDIDSAIQYAVQENATVVVPDHNKQGTNALVFWADRAQEFQFGEGSFQKHVQDCSSGPVQSLHLKSIARDIDWPDDLEALRKHREEGRAAKTNSALDKCTYLNAPTIYEDLK